MSVKTENTHLTWATCNKPQKYWRVSLRTAGHYTWNHPRTPSIYKKPLKPFARKYIHHCQGARCQSNENWSRRSCLETVSIWQMMSVANFNESMRLQIAGTYWICIIQGFLYTSALRVWGTTAKDTNLLLLNRWERNDEEMLPNAELLICDLTFIPALSWRRSADSSENLFSKSREP